MGRGGPPKGMKARPQWGRRFRLPSSSRVFDRAVASAFRKSAFRITHYILFTEPARRTSSNRSRKALRSELR